MSLGMELEKKWYVIHTYSGYENKVKANLERKNPLHGHGRQNLQCNRACRKKRLKKRNGKEKVVERKFFSIVLLEIY